MSESLKLHSLSDEALLRRLRELTTESRRVESDLVAHIAEVDRRRLYLRSAGSSMFTYCTEVLHLSEAEAHLRISAARASKEHPMLLAMLAEGRLHLTAIAKLAPYLTPENRDRVLERASHRSKREIEELVAELAPRPDVPASIRKLPEPRVAASIVSSPRGAQLRPDAVRGESSASDSAGELRLDAVGSAPASLPAATGSVELRPDRIAASPALVQPLAPGRYRLQLTVDAALREKLERLRTLMPEADLAQVIGQAVTEKLQRLEARRFAKTSAPRNAATKPAERAPSRHIPAPVRREVYKRDGARCRFVDDNGRRCTARTHLEFHHGLPFAFSADHSPENVSLLCRAHNQHLAELDYGTAKMARFRRSGLSSERARSSPG